MQVLIELQQKKFSPSVRLELGASENGVLTLPLTSLSLFTDLFFTLKTTFLAQKKFILLIL